MKPSQIKPNFKYSFSVGDLVSVIDPQENESERAIFVIRDFIDNKYLLTAPMRQHAFNEPLWVGGNEIHQAT